MADITTTTENTDHAKVAGQTTAGDAPGLKFSDAVTPPKDTSYLGYLKGGANAVGNALGGMFTGFSGQRSSVESFNATRASIINPVAALSQAKDNIVAVIQSGDTQKQGELFTTGAILGVGAVFGVRGMISKSPGALIGASTRTATDTAAGITRMLESATPVDVPVGQPSSLSLRVNLSTAEPATVTAPQEGLRLATGHGEQPGLTADVLHDGHLGAFAAAEETTSLLGLLANTGEANEAALLEVRGTNRGELKPGQVPDLAIQTQPPAPINLSANTPSPTSGVHLGAVGHDGLGILEIAPDSIEGQGARISHPLINDPAVAITPGVVEPLPIDHLGHSPLAAGDIPSQAAVPHPAVVTADRAVVDGSLKLRQTVEKLKTERLAAGDDAVKAATFADHAQGFHTELQRVSSNPARTPEDLRSLQQSFTNLTDSARAAGASPAAINEMDQHFVESTNALRHSVAVREAVTSVDSLNGSNGLRATVDRATAAGAAVDSPTMKVFQQQFAKLGTTIEDYLRPYTQDAGSTAPGSTAATRYTPVSDQITQLERTITGLSREQLPADTRIQIQQLHTRLNTIATMEEQTAFAADRLALQDQFLEARLGTDPIALDPDAIKFDAAATRVSHASTSVEMDTASRELSVSGNALLAKLTGSPDVAQSLQTSMQRVMQQAQRAGRRNLDRIGEEAFIARRGPAPTEAAPQTQVARRPSPFASDVANTQRMAEWKATALRGDVDRLPGAAIAEPRQAFLAELDRVTSNQARTLEDVGSLQRSFTTLTDSARTAGISSDQIVALQQSFMESTTRLRNGIIQRNVLSSREIVGGLQSSIDRITTNGAAAPTAGTPALGRQFTQLAHDIKDYLHPYSGEPGSPTTPVRSVHYDELSRQFKDLDRTVSTLTPDELPASVRLDLARLEQGLSTIETAETQTNLSGFQQMLRRRAQETGLAQDPVFTKFDSLVTRVSSSTKLSELTAASRDLTRAGDRLVEKLGTADPVSARSLQTDILQQAQTAGLRNAERTVVRMGLDTDLSATGPRLPIDENPWAVRDSLETAQTRISQAIRSDGSVDPDFDPAFARQAQIHFQQLGDAFTDYVNKPSAQTYAAVRDRLLTVADSITGATDKMTRSVRTALENSINEFRDGFKTVASEYAERDAAAARTAVRSELEAAGTRTAEGPPVADAPTGVAPARPTVPPAVQSLTAEFDSAAGAWSHVANETDAAAAYQRMIKAGNTITERLAKINPALTREELQAVTDTITNAANAEREAFVRKGELSGEPPSTRPQVVGEPLDTAPPASATVRIGATAGGDLPEWQQARERLAQIEAQMRNAASPDEFRTQAQRFSTAVNDYNQDVDAFNRTSRVQPTLAGDAADTVAGAGQPVVGQTPSGQPPLAITDTQVLDRLRVARDQFALTQFARAVATKAELPAELLPAADAVLCADSAKAYAAALRSFTNQLDEWVQSRLKSGTAISPDVAQDAQTFITQAQNAINGRRLAAISDATFPSLQEALFYHPNMATWLGRRLPAAVATLGGGALVLGSEPLLWRPVPAGRPDRTDADTSTQRTAAAQVPIPVEATTRVDRVLSDQATALAAAPGNTAAVIHGPFVPSAAQANADAPPAATATNQVMFTPGDQNSVSHAWRFSPVTGLLSNASPGVVGGENQNKFGVWVTYTGYQPVGVAQPLPADAPLTPALSTQFHPTAASVDGGQFSRPASRPFTAPTPRVSLASLTSGIPFARHDIASDYGRTPGGSPGTVSSTQVSSFLLAQRVERTEGTQNDTQSGGPGGKAPTYPTQLSAQASVAVPPTPTPTVAAADQEQEPLGLTTV